MIYFLTATALVIGILIGWAVAVYRMALDKDIHRLLPDEVLCKKPPEGHMLVAVTPDVSRRLANLKNITNEDMRSLLWKQM